MEGQGRNKTAKLFYPEVWLTSESGKLEDTYDQGIFIVGDRMAVTYPEEVISVGKKNRDC